MDRKIYYIRKCYNCGCMAENCIVKDDGEPYIECNWCGAINDVPFEEGEDRDNEKNELLLHDRFGIPTI